MFSNEHPQLVSIYSFLLITYFVFIKFYFYFILFYSTVFVFFSRGTTFANFQFLEFRGDLFSRVPFSVPISIVKHSKFYVFRRDYFSRLAQDSRNSRNISPREKKDEHSS